MMNKDTYIAALDLKPHPEGGWYRQTDHSADQFFDNSSQDARYHYTAIYFLLDSQHPSHFHRLTHDELWFYHDGAAITIHCISPDGTYYRVQLGPDIRNGERLQFTVPHDTIFASEVTTADGFCLVSCVVSPGFDFRDFQLPAEATLLRDHPEQATVIKRLAH